MRSLASVNSAFAGTGVVARAAARRAAAARVNVQASFFKTSTATKPSKSVGNAKKASKLSSGVVLTAGEDIKATQFTADLGFTKKRIALGFTKSNELFVGRAAMLGVAFAIVGEILTGAGPLAQLGYELHESVFDVEVEILAVIAFNLLAAFLPAKGRFVADEEELEERPKGPLQDPRISILEPKKFFGISGFGQFSKENELFVGRVAQLGFASALIGEAITGKGILGQLGLETGLPLNETEPLLLAFVAFTLFAAINPGSGKFVDEK
uniref:Chloroplast photosystem II 22 kDa protein 3 n=1 Tax=Chlorella ohadii TaxID=2649997 RepID=A0A5P4NAU7_9CHLO|nr:chloroplast photosystem II 22 kDa protein 3 [Chlorella ohadii]